MTKDVTSFIKLFVHGYCHFPLTFFFKLVIKNSELVNSFAIIIKQSNRKLSLHIDPKARVID